MKDDIHINSTNQYTNVMPNEPHDIIEFIMDTTNSYAKQLLKKSEGGKGVGTLNYGPEYQFMCSPIVSIEKFEVPILQ